MFCDGSVRGEVERLFIFNVFFFGMLFVFFGSVLDGNTRGRRRFEWRDCSPPPAPRHPSTTV